MSKHQFISCSSIHTIRYSVTKTTLTSVAAEVTHVWNKRVVSDRLWVLCSPFHRVTTSPGQRFTLSSGHHFTRSPVYLFTRQRQRSHSWAGFSVLLKGTSICLLQGLGLDLQPWFDLGTLLTYNRVNACSASDNNNWWRSESRQTFRMETLRRTLVPPPESCWTFRATWSVQMFSPRLDQPSSSGFSSRFW